MAHCLRAMGADRLPECGAKMISILVVLIVAALIAAVSVAVARTSGATPQPGEKASAPTVRRLIVYVLLFALVVIGAVGLSGLLGRLLDAGSSLVRDDTASLALWLAFTLIGGPFAGLLWWFVWRRADVASERESLSWGLYVAGASAGSLVIFASSILSAVSSLAGGNWQPQPLATGLVWAGVWLWHRWMAKHARRRPLRLPSVAPILGAAYGLIVGAGGSVSALGLLFDQAIQGVAAETSLGYPWWRNLLGALVWAAGGSLIWWWYWVRGGVRLVRGPLAQVALAVVGILGGSILMLAGAGISLNVLLRLVFDSNDPAGRILGPLGYAAAAGLIGALVLAYHDHAAAQRSPASLGTARLIESGVALVATASGIGVIVNSLLVPYGTLLAGSGTITLLLGGVSSFLVGAPMWWMAWKPTQHTEGAEGSASRRIYLIAVFGLSAVSALVTLLVLGYRLFEFALDEQLVGALVDRTRAPLGLFVATALVAAYHFSVWRHDRSMAAENPGPQPAIKQVILVATGDALAQKQVIEQQTGATVTLWRREAMATENPGPSSTTGEGTPMPGPDLDVLAEALKDVKGKRVLVVTGAGSAIDVIPLMD